MREPLPWRDSNRQPQPWRPHFEQLVRDHQSMVFSLAFRMTADRGLAEEVAQDVFLELDRCLDRIQSADHARFWLRQVAMHRSADALRRRSVREPGWDDGFWVELEEGHGLIESGCDTALAARIEELLATLPESQRAALVLRYQEDLSPEEIAATLQAPLATVKSHLQRGLKLLRIKAGQGKTGQRLKEFVRGT